MLGNKNNKVSIELFKNGQYILINEKNSNHKDCTMKEKSNVQVLAFNYFTNSFEYVKLDDLQNNI